MLNARCFFSTSVIVFSSLFLSAPPLFAEDIPEGMVVARNSRAIDVLAVNEVRITHQEVHPRTSTSVASITAVFEIDMMVEGNLCGGDPRSVQADIRHGSGPQEVKRIALSYSEAVDPYSTTMRGCSSYSAPRNVTIPLRVRNYIFTGDPINTIDLVISVAERRGRSDDERHFVFAATPTGYVLQP